MPVSKLIIKKLGINIYKFNPSKFLNYDFKNQHIKTVDFIKGFSEKRGNFEIYSFRDLDGNLLGRETVYDNIANSRHIVQQFYYNKINNVLESIKNNLSLVLKHLGTIETIPIDKAGTKICNTFPQYKMLEETSYNNFRNVHRTIYDSVCVQKSKEYQEFYRFNDGKIFSIKEKTYLGNQPSEYIIEGLENRKKRSWLKCMMGKNFNLSNIETSKTIPFVSNLIEYFPLLLSNHSYDFRKRVDYIEKFVAKKLGISNLISSKIDIKPKNNIDTKNCSGFCEIDTGKITIFEEDINDNKKLLSTISHEMQHRKDISDTLRLENVINDFNQNIDLIEKERFSEVLEFHNNSAKRGIILSKSEKAKDLIELRQEFDNYDELCKKIGHDNLECEQRAINFAEHETVNYNILLNEVINYLFKNNK